MFHKVDGNHMEFDMFGFSVGQTPVRFVAIATVKKLRFQPIEFIAAAVFNIKCKRVGGVTNASHPHLKAVAEEVSEAERKPPQTRHVRADRRLDL
jgi:hypothetical protein